MPDGDWSIWLALAGRGWGKTRVLSEFIRHRVEHEGARRIVIAGPTISDVRDIIIEGDSGILSVFPPHRRPQYEPSKRRLTFAGGARAVLLAAEKPDRFRGPQCDTFGADEVASWRFREAFDNLLFGFRLPTGAGGPPRGLVATTPRPIPTIRELLADPGTVVTRGSTYENRANLAPVFLDRILRRFEGTRLGRQELHAELLESVEGALVSRDLIDQSRVNSVPEGLGRCVVALDPAGTANKTSDETGITVNATDQDRQVGYLLADLSGRFTPDEWARTAIALYDEYKADAIVAEVNHGGDMVEDVIWSRRKEIRVIKVRASVGKHIRFEPVAALYEQHRIVHVGEFGQLEDQVCAFTAQKYEGGDSPDRADAHVWGITELMLGDEGVTPEQLYGVRKAA